MSLKVFLSLSVVILLQTGNEEFMAQDQSTDHKPWVCRTSVKRAVLVSYMEFRQQAYDINENKMLRMTEYTYLLKNKFFFLNYVSHHTIQYILSTLLKN